MKKLLKLFFATLFLISASSASAVVVSLSPNSQVVVLGDKFSLDIMYDTEGQNTVGGGFSVNFDDQAFKFDKFEFADNLPDDPAFRVKPDSVDSDTFNLGFGNLTEIKGAGKAGTLYFNANKAGTFNFTLSDPIAGVDPFSEGASYNNAEVQVQVSAVPLPGALWLLMSGIAGLSWMSRSKLN